MTREWKCNCFALSRVFHGACVFIFAVFAQVCMANTTSGHVGVGGITFEKNNNIRMISETLDISMKHVRVKYVFHNDSRNDENLTLLFPLPSYGMRRFTSMGFANEKPLEVKIQVSGRNIPTKKIRRAVHDGKDVTELLRKLGYSDEQIFESFGNCTNERSTIRCNLSAEQITKLREHSLFSSYSDWHVSETIVWAQKFPARKNVDIVVEYAPLVGFGPFNPYLQDGHTGDEKDACIHEGTWAAVWKRVKEIENYDSASKFGMGLGKLEYILGTANNWKGPIGYFRLRIHMRSPEDFVSLCFPGKGKWISKTTVEFEHRNFTPPEKMLIFFYVLAFE